MEHLLVKDTVKDMGKVMDMGMDTVTLKDITLKKQKKQL